MKTGLNAVRLDLDAVARFLNKNVEEVIKMPMGDVIQAQQDFEEQRIRDNIASLKQDENYSALIRKFFIPFRMLSRYFTEDEIVQACAEHNIKEMDLCQEICIPLSRNSSYYHNHPEHYSYKETAFRYISQYDLAGRELAERKRERCEVFMGKSNYQGIVHGEVIKSLLLNRFPELSAYNIECYGINCAEDNYEVYISKSDAKNKGSIYTPFDALMAGDTEKILERNESYCKFYNNGTYSLPEWEKRKEEYADIFELVDSFKNRVPVREEEPELEIE